MLSLILVRGLPGSGKSTFAFELTKAGYIQVEADQYFESEEGYKFDGSKTKDAHAYCRNMVDCFLDSGRNVVVANTFTQLWELAPYFELGKKYGARVTVVEAQGNFKSIHDVPQEVILKMQARWEKL